MSIAGLGTGLLGQISDVASAPRRAVWSMLGLPEQGAAAVSQLTGMDQESPWTKALGVGAEVLGDPLNLLGAPVVGRLGNLLSRLGPKYQKLLSEAKIAGEGFSGADKALDLEKAAMGNRVQDVLSAGEAAIPQGEEAAMLMSRMANASPERLARDAMLATVPPMKNVSRMDPERLRALQAMGLANQEGEAIATLAQPRMMSSGRMSGRHVVEPFHGEPMPWAPPPGDNPALYGPMGFGADTQSGYAAVLAARQEQAKNALIKALQGIEGYNIPALSGIEQAMMMGGAGAMAAPIGRELGRQ